MDSYNYYGLIYNNLNTMITVLKNSDDEQKQFKINAYTAAIQNLPKIITKRLTTPIAGKSILSKINYMIDHDEDLAEVRNYLMQNQFRYADTNIGIDNIHADESDTEIVVSPEQAKRAMSYDESYEGSEEEDSEEELEEDSEEELEEELEEDSEEELEEDSEEELEEDSEEEDNGSVSNENDLKKYNIYTLKTLHKMEKYIYDLDLTEPKVKQIRNMITEYKDNLLKNV
jgi:hypothetical protein